jgi:hypothetical protein
VEEDLTYGLRRSRSTLSALQTAELSVSTRVNCEVSHTGVCTSIENVDNLTTTSSTAHDHTVLDRGAITGDDASPRRGREEDRKSDRSLHLGDCVVVFND